MRLTGRVLSMLPVSLRSQRNQRAPPDQAGADGNASDSASRAVCQSPPSTSRARWSHSARAVRSAGDPGSGRASVSASGPTNVPTWMVSARWLRAQSTVSYVLACTTGVIRGRQVSAAGANGFGTRSAGQSSVRSPSAPRAGAQPASSIVVTPASASAGSHRRIVRPSGSWRPVTAPRGETPAGVQPTAPSRLECRRVSVDRPATDVCSSGIGGPERPILHHWSLLGHSASLLVPRCGWRAGHVRTLAP